MKTYSSDIIKSPCNNICDMKDDICIGCGRTLDEIIEWAMASNERKLEIMQNIQTRGHNGR